MTTVQTDASALWLSHLGGYPPQWLQALRRVHEEGGGLARWVRERHPEAHTIRTDAALQAHVQACKQQWMRQAPPLHKVAFDAKIRTLQHALGTHTRVSRQQGGQLKAKREIRVASLFKEAPRDFLDVIVVHELAHVRERDHNKAFYQLCHHMLPEYAQWEFDMRVYLLSLALEPSVRGPHEDGAASSP